MRILVLDNTVDLKFMKVFDRLLGGKHDIETVDTADTAINRVKGGIYDAIFVSDVKGRYTTSYSFIEAFVGSKLNKSCNVLLYNDGTIKAQRLKAAFGHRNIYFVDDQNLEELLGGL